MKLSWNFSTKFPLVLQSPYNSLPIKSLREFNFEPNQVDRLLGIDYGISHIGLAISDYSWKTAYPYKSFHFQKFPQWVSEMKKMKLKEEMNKLIFVIGYPLTLEGEENPLCQEVLRFLYYVHKNMSLEAIVLWEERFSTCSAQLQLKEWRITKASERKKLVDKEAASLILQDFLDTLLRYQKTGADG